MARIRTIKPEFWTDEDMSELPAETHLLAVALLNHADDEGYFKAHPKLVTAACCPLRDDCTSVRESMQMLNQIGYLRLFTGTDGKEYGHIQNFIKHQRVSHPSESKIKHLDSLHEDSAKAPEDSGKAPDEARREQGKERKGKECANRFEEFWSIWPKKKAKQDAEKAWKQIDGDSIADILIDHVQNRKRQDAEWLKEGGKFIPLPATFLRGRRWEDEWEATSEPNPSEGVL